MAVNVHCKGSSCCDLYELKLIYPLVNYHGNGNLPFPIKKLPIFLEEVPKTNMTGCGKSTCSIGNASSFMVDFSTCHASFCVGVSGYPMVQFHRGTTFLVWAHHQELAPVDTTFRAVFPSPLNIPKEYSGSSPSERD